MTLKPGFLRPEFSLNISMRRMVVAVILLVISTFVLYVFFLALSTLFPLFMYDSMGQTMDITIPPELGYFINFMAVNLCISLSLSWISRFVFPPKFGGQKLRTFTDFLNDTHNINGAFLSFFSRFAFVVMIMFMAMPEMIFEFNLDNRNYLWMLLLVPVMLLSPWQSAIRRYKKKCYRFIFIYIIASLTLSCLLAFYNPISYDLKSQDKIYNPRHHSPINLPTSHFTNYMRRSNGLAVHIALDGNGKTRIFDRQSARIEAQLNSISDISDHGKMPNYHKRFNLSMDSAASLKILDTIHDWANAHKFHTISYLQKPTFKHFKNSYYHIGITSILSQEKPRYFELTPRDPSNPLIPPKPPKLRKETCDMRFALNNEGEVSLNNKLIQKTDIKNKVEQRLEEDKNTSIWLDVSMARSYGEYVDLLSRLRHAENEANRSVKFNSNMYHLRIYTNFIQN